MLTHPVTNFEIQKCCQNELKLNDVYSRNNSYYMNQIAYQRKYG